ncbi:AbrB/MazE/SpoVT family DNA-binding domain-containing protein [Nakamurella sp.]|uniref:AbrB/MazE/SpoVT family DNA-binding domain-containing protein n=1 Tax=Nakamurella sp. TaxID=1869182 RepID=UPI003783DF7B
MKATIDAAGRLVIPRELRDRLGIRPGPVELEADGANLRVRPIATDDLGEADGLLVIPAGHREPITDDDVRALRDADRR